MTSTIKKDRTPWMDTASYEIGVKEFPGARHNPRILNWAKGLGRKLGIAVKDDETPWCGTFAGYVIQANGMTPPDICVRASEWAKFGTALKVPAYGAILVFTRAGGGHVGFYVSEDKDFFHVLGGNQSNQVCVTKIARNRCSAIRWPAGQPLPKTGPVIRAFAGPASTNEA